MAPTHVRVLIALAICGGLAYGVISGVWSIAIFFLLVGIYTEAIAIRDMLAEKQFLETATSLSKLGFTNPTNVKKE